MKLPQIFVPAKLCLAALLPALLLAAPASRADHGEYHFFSYKLCEYVDCVPLYLAVDNNPWDDPPPDWQNTLDHATLNAFSQLATLHEIATLAQTLPADLVDIDTLNDIISHTAEQTAAVAGLEFRADADRPGRWTLITAGRSGLGIGITGYPADDDDSDWGPAGPVVRVVADALDPGVARAAAVLAAISVKAQALRGTEYGVVLARQAQMMLENLPLPEGFSVQAVR